LLGTPSSFLGTYPGHADSDRNFREIDYAPYLEDDWRATQRITVTLGIRCDYATNPTGSPLTTIVNPPFPDTRDYRGAPLLFPHLPLHLRLYCRILSFHLSPCRKNVGRIRRKVGGNYSNRSKADRP